MTNLTRRHFAARAAASLTLAAIPAASDAATGGGASTDPANDLYGRYVALVAQDRAVGAEYDEATARMPEWARPGPQRLTAAGAFEGEIAHMPRDVSITPPVGVKSIICRPCQYDFRRQAERILNDRWGTSIVTWRNGDEVRVTRRTVRTWYMAELRALEARYAAQEAEEARVGLPRIEQALEAIGEARCDARAALAGLPPSLNAAAAVLLTTAALTTRLDTSAMQVETLDFMRPALTGLIRAHVELLIDAIDADPFVTTVDMPFGV
ncbi:MAG: hypothetical protein KIT48_12095 [Pseudolabrys sp.]|nr:hypothetical protein [Pseudolabrys sp.]